MGKIIDLPMGSQLEIGKAGSLKPDLELFTSAMEPDQYNNRLVHMTGSSTEEDMSGDTMSIHALNSMTKMAPNLTIWLNHDYTLPDSIFGSVQGRASIIHQNGIADLKFAGDVEFDNPAAARVKRYIDNGRRLGCSIGCMVTKVEVPDPDEDGDDWFQRGIIIHDVYVVEFSVVGIPCNQRSWVENGIKGLFNRTLDYRLAPAMKTLWPRQYHEIMKNRISSGERNDNIRKIIDGPTRSPVHKRVDWHAPTKTFIFSSGSVQKSISREDLAAYLADQHNEPQGEIVQIEEETEQSLDDILEPTNDGEESMNKNIVTKKADKDIIAYAINKDGTQGIEVKAGGNHEPTTGTHAHTHDSFGHGDVDAHHHEHDHDNDNVHHHDHSDVPHASDPDQDGDAARDIDNDGDGKKPSKPKKEGEPELIKQVTANPANITVVVASHTQDQDESVLLAEDTEDVAQKKLDAIDAATHSEEKELDEATITALKSYNLFGQALGLPEVTTDHLKAARHPALTRAVAAEHMGHVTAIHDHAAALGGCNYVASANETNLSDARNEAAYGAGREVIAGDHMAGIGRLSETMGSLAKAFEGLNVEAVKQDVATVTKELSLARKQLDTLYVEIGKAAETVASLKNMPLGNPLHQQRSVQSSNGTASREELLAAGSSAAGNLEASLALTTIETKKFRSGLSMTYRCWPAGVGKDVRPQLTSDQISLMNFEDIKAYREGLEARVPMVDDPLQSSYSL